MVSIETVRDRVEAAIQSTFGENRAWSAVKSEFSISGIISQPAKMADHTRKSIRDAAMAFSVTLTDPEDGQVLLDVWSSHHNNIIFDRVDDKFQTGKKGVSVTSPHRYTFADTEENLETLFGVLRDVAEPSAPGHRQTQAQRPTAGAAATHDTYEM